MVWKYREYGRFISRGALLEKVMKQMEASYVSLNMTGTCERSILAMSDYAICGDFYGKTITGIQRVAYETVAELDKIVEKGEIEVVVPEDAIGVPEYINLKVVRIQAEKGKRHLWIQVHFPKYLRKNHKTGVTMCNEAPLFRPGIAYIHDIY